MAATSKISYPKALPFQSPADVAAKQCEDLAAQAKRLNQRNEDLVNQVTHLRRWIMRLGTACAILALLVVAGIVLVIKFPSVLLRSAPPPPAADAREAPAALDGGPSLASKPAPTSLPAQAVAKPESSRLLADSAPALQKAGLLEALGGMSATHLYQSQLNIGLLADAVESETYTVEEAEKSLQSVVDLMKLVDAHLAAVTKSGLDADDQDSIREIQGVTAMLHQQATSLRAYWATGATEHAEEFHKARKSAARSLSRIMGLDEK